MTSHMHNFCMLVLQDMERILFEKRSKLHLKTEEGCHRSNKRYFVEVFACLIDVEPESLLFSTYKFVKSLFFPSIFWW